jgi:hypothetical protein
LPGTLTANLSGWTGAKVVITADGKNETILKSGKKLVADTVHYTWAFEQIDGDWKLFYHHFSGTMLN